MLVRVPVLHSKVFAQLLLRRIQLRIILSCHLKVEAVDVAGIIEKICKLTVIPVELLDDCFVDCDGTGHGQISFARRRGGLDARTSSLSYGVNRLAHTLTMDPSQFSQLDF
jgi:hypothetical protein